MTYGVQTFNAAGSLLVDSAANYNGVIVDVVSIPTSGGPFTYSYPAFSGTTLLAVFDCGAVSVSIPAQYLSGSPPSITINANAAGGTMFILASAGAPYSSDYGIECQSDYGGLLPIHHVGSAACLIAKTTSATAISFSTPYNGTWAYGWRYTVTTHEYAPLVFVVPPTTGAGSAGLWLERVAWVSGSTGAKAWEVDVGCYDIAAGGRIGPPTLLAFDRRTLVTSGATYGIQVFNASGVKTYDSNDPAPLRVGGIISFPSYFGASPSSAANSQSFPAGVTTPAIWMERNAGLKTVVSRFVSSPTQYRYSFMAYRKNSDGLLWRSGDGYQYAYNTDPGSAGIKSTTTTYNLPAESLLVIDAALY